MKKNLEEKTNKKIIHFVPYWALKENQLGQKKAQDKSQKRGDGLGMNA